MGDLVQREHPQIRVESGWGQEHIKAAKSPKRCKIGPRLLLWTNRKSPTRFRLAPKSSTFDDLERPIRYSCRSTEINIIFGAHQKHLNEDRFIVLAATCRPMILVARKIRYMQIGAGVSTGRRRQMQTACGLTAGTRRSLRAANHAVIGCV